MRLPFKRCVNKAPMNPTPSTTSPGTVAPPAPSVGDAIAAAYTLVTGNFATNMTTLGFDGKALTLGTTFDMPLNPSWVEPGTNGMFHTISDDKLALTLKLNDKGAEVVNKVPVDCEGPTHMHKIASGVVLVCYGGGAVLHIPTGEDGALGEASTHARVQLPYAYEGKTPPKPNQDMSRAHGSVSTADGKIWVADLGSDSVWRLAYGANQLTLEEEFKTPQGWGPRHLATPDGKSVYVIGEMGNGVAALVSGAEAVPVSIVPEDAKQYADLLGGGEIVAHPKAPTLYASNRNQVAITKKHPDYKAPKGDSVAIMSAAEAGQPPKLLKQMPTGCDHIRGMKLSPDGNFIAVAGMNNKRLEIYAISGQQMDEWTLVAEHDGIDQVTDVAFFPKAGAQGAPGLPGAFASAAASVNLGAGGKASAQANAEVKA